MKRIEDQHAPPTEISANQARPTRRLNINRDQSDDPARAQVVDRFCHCHPQARDVKREMNDLAVEYTTLTRAWLAVQCEVWRREWTGCLGSELTKHQTCANNLLAKKAEVLRKIRDRAHMLEGR